VGVVRGDEGSRDLCNRKNGKKGGPDNHLDKLVGEGRLRKV
jgi:hypothetical protein